MTDNTMKNSNTYDVHVTRDGRWWMIEVPALDVLTQARRVSDVEEQARSLIAVTLDVAPSTVEIGHVEVDVSGIGDVREVTEHIAQLRRDAREAEEEAARLSRSTAEALVKAEVPMRDVGTLLGVSHQRVAQLVNS